MSIQNKNDEIQSTNVQKLTINDLKSLFKEDEQNKWETNQCKQTESINNTSYPERTDISYVPQSLGRCLRKFDEPSINENSKRIKDVNIIMKKTNKSFDLCLKAYLMTNDVSSSIRILS